MNKIEGLDALRFFAFFNVLLFHTTNFYGIGALGVDFFFVLSSFLLTFLTLKEIEKTGDFSRFRFFIRRAFRIFPLYFLIVLSSFFVLPLFQQIVHQEISLPKNKFLYYFFLSNYDTEDCIFALKFLWSVAVEEQFYLLFLIVAPFFKKNLFIVPCLLLIIYFTFDFFPVTDDIHNYYSVLYHLPNFIVGITGGILFYQKNTGKKYWLPISIGVLIVAVFLKSEQFFYICFSVLCVCLIFLSVYYYSFIKRFFPVGVFEKLGQYTYGLYVYSGFVITLVLKTIPTNHPLVLLSTSLFLLIPVSVLSFRLFEKPFLNLKKHFYPADKQTGAHALMGSVSDNK